jgi:hypothetical protein
MTLDTYEPSIAPDPQQWLALDEAERIALVADFHRLRRIKLPNLRAHATLQAIVETQLAMATDSVVRAMDRLKKQGLDRHDALHAIAAVLAAYLNELFKEQISPSAPGETSPYDSALDLLTAKRWRQGHY